MNWEYFIEDLWALLQRGGWVFLAIFVVAQVGWFLVLERWWFLRRMSFSARRFWRHAPSDPDALQAYAASLDPRRGLFPRLIKSIAEARPLGETAMVNRTHEILESEVPTLQRHLSTLSILASTAPLLGLMGTISGMVTTFQTITQFGASNPTMLAGGISEALLTTEAGLVAAFPLVLCHNWLLNRAGDIEDACISGATRLINAYRGQEA